jgi:hypothetical protein
MIRADAAAAVTRVLFEARRALPTKPVSFDRLAFAAKRDAAPGGLARRPAAAR